MPLTKKHKKKVLKGGNKKLNGGKPCPAGTQKVCIKKGDLIKLLKKVSVSTSKTKKNKSRNKKMRATRPIGQTTAKPESTFLGSIFGEEVKPKNPVEEPVEKSTSEEKPVAESSTPSTVVVETEPTLSEVKKEKMKTRSFIESIFGSEEKPEEVKSEEVKKPSDKDQV